MKISCLEFFDIISPLLAGVLESLIGNPNCYCLVFPAVECLVRITSRDRSPGDHQELPQPGVVNADIYDPILNMAYADLERRYEFSYQVYPLISVRHNSDSPLGLYGLARG